MPREVHYIDAQGEWKGSRPDMTRIEALCDEIEALDEDPSIDR